jgi:hypothetical protein
MAICHTTSPTARVLEEAAHRMEPLGTSRPIHWHQLLRLVLYWALYRRPPREHANLIDAARASQTNVQLQQEVQTMTQQVWKVGPEAWLEEGQTLGLRMMLQRQLQKKFKQLPEAVVQRIAGADLEKLKAACLQVLDLKSLDELQL